MNLPILEISYEWTLNYMLCIYVKRGKEIPQLPTEHRYSVQCLPQELWLARVLYNQKQQS